MNLTGKGKERLRFHGMPLVYVLAGKNSTSEAPMFVYVLVPCKEMRKNPKSDTREGVNYTS